MYYMKFLVVVVVVVVFLVVVVVIIGSATFLSADVFLFKRR